MVVRKNGSAPRRPKYAAPRPTLAELKESGEDFNRTMTDFLKVDVSTGLTFTELALTTEDPEKKRRNRKSARRAYDTVTKQMKKVHPSDRDMEELDANLDRLRAELTQLGEVL